MSRCVETETPKFALMYPHRICVSIDLSHHDGDGEDNSSVEELVTVNSLHFAGHCILSLIYERSSICRYVVQSLVLYFECIIHAAELSALSPKHVIRRGILLLSGS